MSDRTVASAPNGGYEPGYAAVPCFWGTAPGSLLPRAMELLVECDEPSVLDLGCGEGKNAAFIARERPRATIVAVDVSARAIQNGRGAWGDLLQIEWLLCDAHEYIASVTSRSIDLVIAYGLTHCLVDSSAVESMVSHMARVVRTGGVVVLVAFNDRRQELELAHPGFYPSLLAHKQYEGLFSSSGLQLVSSTDSDLYETHPHNGIAHHHSMTRLIARRP